MFRSPQTWELLQKILASKPKSPLLCCCFQGKLNTEEALEKRGVNWTSIRPVYIYGPLNYNPVEEWFFQRIQEGRPIPVPNSGMQVVLTRSSRSKVDQGRIEPMTTTHSDVVLHSGIWRIFMWCANV